MRFWIAALLCLPAAAQLFDSNKPEEHAAIEEHFKYGSIGAEERAGVPLWIWVVLPDLFPQHLPQRPGKGYEKFGLVYEPGKTRPIGTSRRERRIPFAGLNCAVCHTGTIRDTPASPRRIVLGMPAHQFDLQAYQRFLFACIRDDGFTVDRIIPAIEKVNPEFSLVDKLAYRFAVIPQTRSQGLDLARSFSWTYSRPPTGPGRVDTFNPYKAMFGFDMEKDTSVGTADLPPLFDQKSREGLWLHWDGNNNAVTERNKSAAIGAGASEESLDLPAMKRVEDWIWTLPPPAFPADKINQSKAAAGKLLYDKHCAECHAIGGKYTGQTEPLAKIGTDPERVNSFTQPLVDKMNTLGTGRPWKFTHFRKTDGYANMPLSGVWLRAPYLHNGSVPTLRDLMEKPEKRPARFHRGYDVYDYDAVGFVSQGPDAVREGFLFDTAKRGNGNQGHVYGTDLSAADKAALLEYLKTI